jgi:alpha-beta hydrolase superfamily lysophospholipase
LLVSVLACAPRAPRMAPTASEAARRPPSAAVVDTGHLGGAAYRIDIPRGWTGGLVLYAHGYEVPGAPPSLRRPQTAAMREVFLSRGFAVAQSDYRAQGWAVAEGVGDTEALRRSLIGKYGRPGRTFLVGQSMGAHIAIATMERHGAAYDGALVLCAPLTPALDFMSEQLFDLLVTVDALVPGALPAAPAGLADPTAPRMVDAAVLESTLQRAPQASDALARRFGIRPTDLRNVIAYYYLIVKELQQRAGGNPFDNTGTVYSGFGDDTELNRRVRRYSADRRAVEYLRTNYSPSGQISDPVLSLHTTYDPIVAPRFANGYARITEVAGTQEHFVGRFVAADGHCAINTAQIGAAFDVLQLWAKSGARPAGGEMR